MIKYSCPNALLSRITGEACTRKWTFLKVGTLSYVLLTFFVNPHEKSEFSKSGRFLVN